MNVNTNEFQNYLHVWIVRMSMASEEYNLSSDEDLDFGDIAGEILPYENEPLAPTGAESGTTEDDEEDIDGFYLQS